MPEYLNAFDRAGPDARAQDERLRSISLVVGSPIVVAAWLLLVHSLLAR